MLPEDTASGRGPGRPLISLEICAGAGGLSLGLERAGFDPVMLIDIQEVACQTLRLNRPGWEVREMDVRHFDPSNHRQVHDVDLLVGGLPRVKSTATAGRARGNDEELEILWTAIKLVHDLRPRALLLENIPDLVCKEAYASTRERIGAELERLGYGHRWFVLNAADYGVPQNRRQGILVAFRDGLLEAFQPPPPLILGFPPTVGEALGPSMAMGGWPHAEQWAAQAGEIAPTLVGGSGDRGGADLGPRGSKKAWARMGVNGGSLADQVPGPDFVWDPGRGPDGMVRLTVEQAALLQGFPPDWRFAGGKTKRYRQIGNASPPPVGEAVGEAVRTALENA
jgi:DNA (cytosine-5)-methyltransferase 1